MLFWDRKSLSKQSVDIDIFLCRRYLILDAIISQ